VRFVLLIGNEKAIESKPVFISGGWQFQVPVCPAHDEKKGCTIPYESRPETCRIYPFIRVETIKGPRIYLDLSRCPNWVAFGQCYNNVIKEIK